MATVRLDNLSKPRFKNLPEGDLKKEYTNLPIFTDLKLDLEMAKSIGNGLNVVYSNDIVVSTNREAIKNSIYNIFSTKKGEMILNPTFGSSLDMFLFEKVTPIMGKKIGDTIYSTIKQYEPRIVLNRVDVYPRPDENLYRINIVYRYLELTELLEMQVNQEGIMFL
jgi:phage baseplate assembly protein W